MDTARSGGGSISTGITASTILSRHLCSSGKCQPGSLRCSLRHKGLHSRRSSHDGWSCRLGGGLTKRRTPCLFLISIRTFCTIFSQDQAKHFCESRGVCPLCKGNDNRLHRLMYCPGTLDLRQRSPGITRLMADLPISTVAYGLWEEHPSLRAWHGSLDALSFPQVPRVASNDPRILYSDGTCLHPRYKDIRLAAGAVIEAHGGADWKLVWTGVLPTADQSTFRAELLAGIIAVHSSTALWLFSDCWAFVKVARRFLAAKRTGIEPRWPTANLDLWIRFWEALNGLDYGRSDMVCGLRLMLTRVPLVGSTRSMPFLTMWLTEWQSIRFIPFAKCLMSTRGWCRILALGYCRHDILAGTMRRLPCGSQVKTRTRFVCKVTRLHLSSVWGSPLKSRLKSRYGVSIRVSLGRFRTGSLA